MFYLPANFCYISKFCGDWTHASSLKRRSTLIVNGFCFFAVIFQFKTWKDELDCMTERNEQQIILDAVQSFLRYMLSVWTSDR